MLEIDQLSERHAKDGIGLHSAQVIRIGDSPFFLIPLKAIIPQRSGKHGSGAGHTHQAGLRLGLRGRSANDTNDFVNVGQRQQQAFNRMFSPPGLGQQKLSTPPDDGDPMPNKLLQQFLETERAGFAINQREKDDRERILQRRELIELVEHDIGVVAAFDFNFQPDRLFQIADVGNGADAFDLATIDQGRDPFHDAIAELLVRNFLDDDLVAALAYLLDLAARTDHDRATARVITAANAAATADHATCREVGTLHDLHQFVDRNLGVVNHAGQCITDFAQIMRWNRRGHAHRDA